jgi:hypothetical protein
MSCMDCQKTSLPLHSMIPTTFILLHPVSLVAISSFSHFTPCLLHQPWVIPQSSISTLDAYPSHKQRVATLALGSQPRQGLAKVRAKNELGSFISCSWECKRVWGNEPPHSQVSSHFGRWSPNGLPNLQRVIAGVKLIGLRSYLYHWKALET